MWLAAYVITLAHSTGWPEAYILWELPMARGLQYQHSILCMNGAKTLHKAGGLEKEIDDIADQLNLKELALKWQQPT